MKNLIIKPIEDSPDILYKKCYLYYKIPTRDISLINNIIKELNSTISPLSINKAELFSYGNNSELSIIKLPGIWEHNEIFSTNPYNIQEVDKYIKIINSFFFS